MEHSSSIFGILGIKTDSIQDRPQIISLPDVTAIQKRVTMYQDPVQIVCTVASSTPIKVSWTFNGSPVPDRGITRSCRTYMGFSPLPKVKKAPPNRSIHTLVACRLNYTTDQGKYACHARNWFGSVSTEMTLTIYSKSFFVVFLMNQV